MSGLNVLMGTDSPGPNGMYANEWASRDFTAVNAMEMYQSQ